MKKLIYMILTALLAASLVSCAKAPSDTAGGLLKPGSKIGNMTVENSSESYSSLGQSVWSFCTYESETPELRTRTVDCHTTKLPWVSIEFGWGAKPAMLASNWDAMAWEMYIDKQKIDLNSFGWSEMDMFQSGEKLRARNWFVVLTNPSLGKHIFRFLWTSRIPVNDGFDTFQPGTYEHVVNLTISDN